MKNTKLLSNDEMKVSVAKKKLSLSKNYLKAASGSKVVSIQAWRDAKDIERWANGVVGNG